ncbi:MAG: 50S ribosomal protein L11 methyltransferase [Clostridia bacterium]|nr:50S ribosomal protein L11 methyltransferase [Clostridia bacterium]
MNWNEIKITVPVGDLETAAAIANMAVPYGIYIEDYSNLEADAKQIAHIDLIDEELIKKDRNSAVIHIYISSDDNAAEALIYLEERLCAAGIAYTAERVTVNDEDWNENWKKYFKAFEIGKRLAVCPSWETYDNKENRKVISLDPGAAFGTGTHATTSLCLNILEDTVTKGAKVLDIGTGSGILAIAACLLGADSATGVDIDELAVETARANSKRNNTDDKTGFFVGDLADKVSGKYDIVCANIVADVVMRLFDDVAGYMADNACLIVSGIIDIRAKEVEESAAAHGFKIIKAPTREEWHAYLLKKA